MTYCLGLLIEDGLLLVADTRTNGGIDHIASFRKLHSLACTPDRQIHVATAGSLSASQSALGELRGDTLANARSIIEAAERVGAVLGRANARLREALGPDRSEAGATALVGGRIGDEAPRLFQVYREGNFIECQPDMPYLQIGETKLGRVVLDRLLRADTPLPLALKIALLSFDSAMRSNLSVALPIDLAMVPSCPAETAVTVRLADGDPYLTQLRRLWSESLLAAADRLPDAPFLGSPAAVPALSLVG